MTENLVIYHSGCKDGFAAAWLAKRALEIPMGMSVGEPTQYVAAQYGQPPPDVRGKHVYLLDFCYPRAVLEAMIKEAASVIVIDHHETAVKDWKDLEGLVVHYDNNCSGARLTQEIFRLPDHWIIDYTEDRDLWRWKLPFSREVSAYLGTLEFEFPVWDAVSALSPETVAPFGAAVLREVQNYAKTTAREAIECELFGMKVPVVNAAYGHLSEVLEILGQGRPFAAGWHQRADGKFKYSLRSDPMGMHVGELAQRYGGGGHKHSAGFEVDYPIHFAPHITSHRVRLPPGAEGLRVEMLDDEPAGDK